MIRVRIPSRDYCMSAVRPAGRPMSCDVIDDRLVANHGSFVVPLASVVITPSHSGTRAGQSAWRAFL